MKRPYVEYIRSLPKTMSLDEKLEATHKKGFKTKANGTPLTKYDVANAINQGKYPKKKFVRKYTKRTPEMLTIPVPQKRLACVIGNPDEIREFIGGL